MQEFTHWAAPAVLLKVHSIRPQHWHVTHCARMMDQQGLKLAASEARTLNAGANTVKLHLLSFLRCLVWGEIELIMKMGRPCSSGAYSTTEPEGKPAAGPSDATVDSVPVLHVHKQHFQMMLLCTLLLRLHKQCIQLMLSWTVFPSCMHTNRMTFR